MAEEPAATVIVLGYNGRAHVDSCLPSVLDQDFELPYEVLFVDNGSKDGTADAAARYEGVRVHRLDRNFGYCQGNNIGASLAKAPLVVFLNQDVVVHRSWLRELVAAVESDDAIKAAHPNVIHPWNPEYGNKEREAPARAAYSPELSPLGFVAHKQVRLEPPVQDTLFLSGVSIILDKRVLPEIGGYPFDPAMFAYGEDLDLGLRLRLAGYRTVVATRAVIYHSHTLEDRLGLTSLFKTVRIIRNRILAFWKNSDWLEFLPLFLIAVVGSPFNSGQFGLPAYKKVLYFFLLIPPTLVAAAAAFVEMPKYAARRREILQNRRVGRGWLLRTMLFDRARLARPAGARAG